MTLAIVILTNNEEINIVDVINNARQCTDEILVIDSGSTDKTVELGINGRINFSCTVRFGLKIILKVAKELHAPELFCTPPQDFSKWFFSRRDFWMAGTEFLPARITFSTR